MSKPFNFYQGSGAPYPNGFSGVFTPTGMLETSWYYQWRADQDVYEQKPQLEVRVSGQVGGGASYDAYYQAIVYSGSLMGLKSGFADLRTVFTGQKSKANIDAYSYQSRFTGRISGYPQEFGEITLKITGAQKAYPIDVGDLDLSFSGQMPLSVSDSANFKSSFSGNIIKSDKDLVSFSVTFSGVEWNSYRPRIKTPITPDSAAMSLSIVRIVWSRAGG
jgi:hypothetical protein